MIGRIERGKEGRGREREREKNRREGKKHHERMMLGILKTLGKHFILSLDRRLEDSETLQMAP